MLTRPGSMLSTENGIASEIGTRKRAPSDATKEYEYNEGLEESPEPAKKRRTAAVKGEEDDDESMSPAGRRSRAKQPAGKQADKAGRKQNHVAAEKKRREAIRRGFDRITAVVPDLENYQSRSEALVLEKTVLFLQNLNAENAQLLELAKKHNVDTSSNSPL